MADSLEVAIVVLNWNGWEDTRECLESLREISYAPVEVYVVDNGSVDGSPQRIARDFPEVKLLRLTDNRGFGGGMNVGIEKALKDNHDFILCLNNDMTVDPGLLEPLVRSARNQGSVPYPAIYQYEAPHLLDNLGNTINLYTGLPRRVAHGSSQVPPRIEADYSELPLLSKELLEALGDWNEEFFAFYEDTEFGLRMREAGWELVCVSEAKVFHRRGRTARRVRGLVSYYNIRNRLLLVRMHGTRLQYVTTLLHVLLLIIPYIAIRCLVSSRYKHSFRHTLLGLRDGLFPSRRTPRREWEPPLPRAG
ncbi:MAG: glycosyltransferase family 2 protein [Thermoplasmata archaeon]